MNFSPSPEELSELRKKYPMGTEVILLKTDDFQAPPVGIHGTVRCVDDAGSIYISWDNGSSLAAIPNVNIIEIFKPIS